MMKQPRNKAIVIADALIGLGVIGILLGTTISVVLKQQEAMSRLTRNRVAVSLAEQAMTTLQTGGEWSSGNEMTDLNVRTLDDSPGVGHFVWVEIRATVGDESATLIGLADAEAAKAAKGAP